MTEANLSGPSYRDLRPEVDKLGQKDKLELLKYLSFRVKLSEEGWQELAPILLPEELRRKFLQYPWSLEDRRNLGLIIKVPILLQDPSFIRDKLKPELGPKLIEVGWEPGMTDGPTSARIAVEDQYGTEPAKWDEGKHCFLDEKEQPITLVDEQEQPKTLNLSNEQFHQVNAWAIAKRILEFYEDYNVLGRVVPLGFNGNRLIIKPHAHIEAIDTGYNPDTRTLEFGYADHIDHCVYACLSHDVVAHETGHAVLDGIRPYFNDSWTFETLAFHEFVADLTALMSSLRNNSVRNIFTGYLKNDLPEKDFLAKIGEELGQVIRNSDYIRSAENKDTMDDVHELQIGWLQNDSRNSDPIHKSSQVLTGLIYDLLLKLCYGYWKRERTPDQASWYATRRLTQMALQPLDFLPPVDVAFSDYIEAFLIRDQLIDPEDEHRYRPQFRELCGERKIKTLPEDQLAKRPRNLTNPQIDGLLASRTSAYEYIHANREALRIPAKQDIVVDVYTAQKVDRTSFRLPQEIIVQYIWKEDVQLKGEEFENLKIEEVPLLCGGTLVFDDCGNFRYWVDKPGTEFGDMKGTEGQQEGERRKKDLIDYCRFRVAKGDEDAIKELSSGRFINRL